jgi:periplasmic protein TonB
MKRFLNSQIYFLASVLLHVGILLFLVLNSDSFSRNNDNFEAAVMFESPNPPASKLQPQKPTQKPATKQPKAPKPISAPKLKSPAKPSISSGPSPTSPITSQRLDDILKRKSVKIKPEEKPVEPIVKKKSDLLGYLKATKRKKEPEQQLEPNKPPSGQLLKKAQQLQGPPPQAAEKEKQPKPIDKQPAEEPTAKTTGKIEGKASDSSTTSKKPAALQVWQKKKDVQSYRSILGKLVTANWTVPPVSVKKFQIVIEATIDKNGNLVSIQLLEGSGLAILDAAAERAIRVSTPFPGFPASIEQDNSDFTAVFRFTPDQVVY